VLPGSLKGRTGERIPICEPLTFTERGNSDRIWPSVDRGASVRYCVKIEGPSANTVIRKMEAAKVKMPK
jgi:hypothetical protein